MLFSQRTSSLAARPAFPVSLSSQSLQALKLLGSDSPRSTMLKRGSSSSDKMER